MSLFRHGGFKLHSGASSTWKIDCDALTDEDLEVIAELISTIVPPFGKVEGVPRGGLRLAEAMGKHAGGPAGRLLIVDDVLTTGLSMEIHRGEREAYGAVIFSRASDWPTWIRPLFAMPSLREERSHQFRGQ